MDKERLLNVLSMIAQDMIDDATKYEGKPFNGAIVGEYFGNLGAAIAALADIVAIMLKEKEA